MAESAASSGRPAGSGGSRSSAIRRGFEPYNPGSRLASARGNASKGRSTGGGHDTSRGNALWEDDREPTRGSRVEKEWKHDMFESEESADPPRGGNSANGGVRVRGRGATRASASSTAAEAGGGRSGGAPPAAVEVEATVPSEERYEDLSRRVEEEVVAKLARAQMMGMMLKAHREQQQQHHGHQAVEKRRARGGGGGVRREGGSGSGPGNQSSRRSRAGSSSRQRSGGPSPEPSATGASAAVVGPSAAAPPLVPTVAAAAPARGPPATARDGARLMVGPTAQGRGYAGPPPTRKPSPPPHHNGQGRGDPRPAGLLKVSPEVLAAGTPAASPSPAEAIPEKSLLDGANLEEMSLEEAYVTVGKLEQQHKALAAQLRREIGHFGEAPGVELLFRRVSWVRDALSQALGSLVRRDPILSLRKRLPNRLWMAHYRALEVVQHRLRQLGQQAAAEASSASGGTGAGAQQMRQAKQRRQKQRQALRTRLFELIEEAERGLWGMVETVERQMVETKSRVRQAAASPASSQYSSSLSPGRSSGASDDFESNLHDASSGGEPTEGSGEEGSDAEVREEEKNISNTHEVLGRQLALQAFLTSLGDLCRYRGLYAEAVSTGGNGDRGGDDRAVSWSRAEELYRRALRVDPSSGKVWNQMAVLASCRQDNLEAFYAYMRGLCSAAPYPAGRESLLVLHENCKARLSTVRAATALDALGLEEHRARFRLYLLGACGTCLSRVDLGAFDGYLALSERHMVSCVQLYLMRSETDRGDGGGNGLEGTLARAIVLCICTASAAFEAWRERDAEDGSWTTDPATSRAVRLCMSLAASLAGLHRKTTRRGWEQVTAAGVSVFLDWLTCRPQFGEGARGTRLEEFQHTMACVVEFTNGVIRSAGFMGGGRGNGNAAGGISLTQPREKREEGEGEVDPDGALWEDEECRGLPALAVAAERRVAKAQRKSSSKTSIPRRRRPLPAGGGNSSSLSPADATPTSMEALTNKRGGRGSSRDVTNRGGKGRGGEVLGRRRRANSSSRARTTSWAADDDDCLVTPGAGGGGEGVVDPWKIRVARIRKQVEFCVERGWISRGNRAGTYTLPKPPPSSSMRHGSPRAGDTFSPTDQQRREGPSGAVSGSLWVGSNDVPSGRKGKGKGGGGRGGNGSLSLSQPSPRRDEGRTAKQQPSPGRHGPPAPGKPNLSQTPPQTPTVKPPSGPTATAMANGRQTSGNGVGFGADARAGLTGTVPMGDSVAEAEAAAVAQALSSLHLEMRAQEDSGGGDALRSTNSGFGAAPAGVPPLSAVVEMPPPPDIEQGFSNSSVIYPGTVGGPPPGLNSSVQQQQVLSDTTGVFYPGTMVYPDPGMVPTIQQQQQGLSDSTGILYPGTMVGSDPGMATAEAAISAAVEPTGGIMTGGVDEDNPLPESLLGIVLAGLGSAEENLCQYCCATLEPVAVECSTCGTPTQASTATAPATATGQAAITAAGLLTTSPRTMGRSDDVAQVMALPAGVLAVDNLAEVIASSQRSKSPMHMPSGGGGRARAREASDPTSIARAGLGDGGARAGSVPATGGGKMFGWPRGAPRSSALPLVVIDVPNVAMRHGLNKRFSCKGMQMAVEYFRTAGHRVVGFLPDYLLDQKRTNGLERAKKLGVAEVKASRLPDDIPLLQRLVDDGVIVATPPQDYDDSYCIKYAMAKDGYLVTNDLYRDHVKGIDGRKKADAARRWIKSHSISYTFVGDEFFPNPDFSFHQGQQGGGGPP